MDVNKTQNFFISLCGKTLCFQTRKPESQKGDTEETKSFFNQQLAISNRQSVRQSLKSKQFFTFSRFHVFFFFILIFVLFSVVKISNADEVDLFLPTVQSENLMMHIIALQENIKIENGDKITYRSRSSYNREAIRNAENYIVSELKTVKNLRVEIDEFGGMHNVVATLPAYNSGDDVKIYIICAHYDSKASKEKDWNPVISLAPGADDNASGVAAMLEIAKILGSTQCRNEIKFIAFDAEEIGRLGSKHYAKLADEQKLNIAAVINLDMIGFNWKFDVVDVITDSPSSWIADYLPVVSEWYGLELKASKVVDATIDYGDHKSFWDAGYNAIMLIENATPWWSNADYQANDFYHTYKDTYDKLNIELVRKITQIVLAAVYQMANSSSADRNPLMITIAPVNVVRKDHLKISGRFFSDSLLRIAVEPGDVLAHINRDTGTYSANIKLNKAGDNLIKVTAISLYGEKTVETTIKYIPEFQLESAIVYPNPFNPLKNDNMVFRFEGNRQIEQMKVFVYASDGTLVRSFRGISPDKKVWRVWWNAGKSYKKISSGVYSCVFETDVEGKTYYSTVKLAVIR